MIRKILKNLGKLAPSFLHSLDDQLIVQHPLVWSLRLHYVIYYNTLVVLIFTAIVYSLPVAPLGAYNLLYISYLSLGLSVFSMGLWLFAQNQYNIQKSHGICGPFFYLKYTLLVFFILVVFIGAAFTPVWLATQRAYVKLVGEDIINLINSQPDEAFNDYWDRQIQRYDFFRNLPDKYSVQIGKASFLPEESETLSNNRNQFFRILYDNYWLEGRSDLPQENFTESTGKKISFQGKTFTQYVFVQDSYYEYKQFVYLDQAGNPYFLHDLVNRAFIDRLIRQALPELDAGLQQILDEDVILSDYQLTKYVAIYSIIIEPPGLYSLIGELAYEEYGLLVLVSLVFPALLTIMLATTTANLFGTKAFFVDTTSSLAFCIFILTLILVADNSYDIDEVDFIILVSAGVFLLSTLTNIVLRKCTRRRKAASFFWQVSTFCIPISLFFGMLLPIEEYTDFRIEEEFAFGSVFIFCLLSLLVLFPLQFRLAHKLFALPR